MSKSDVSAFTVGSQNHMETRGRGSPNHQGGTTRKSTPSVFIGNGAAVLVTFLVCLLLWGVFGILLVVFGPSWGAFGGLLGVFGSSWGVFGPFGGDFGGALGASGVSSGRLWGAFGNPWGVFGPPWAPMTNKCPKNTPDVHPFYLIFGWFWRCFCVYFRVSFLVRRFVIFLDGVGCFS